MKLASAIEGAIDVLLDSPSPRWMSLAELHRQVATHQTTVSRGSIEAAVDHLDEHGFLELAEDDVRWVRLSGPWRESLQKQLSVLASLEGQQLDHVRAFLRVTPEEAIDEVKSMIGDGDAASSSESD